MIMVKSVLLVGVGGQGTILVSKLLTAGLIEAGYDVKMSEVHGMAQRGGSVSTQVRYGEKVYSPIIGEGQADILVSFERMEAARYSSFLKPGGTAVINDYSIPSVPVATGAEQYPEGVIEEMSRHFRTISFDAMKIAGELGSTKCMNVVLFGALVKFMGLEDIDWESVIAKNVPPKFIEMNQKAFKAGMAQG